MRRAAFLAGHGPSVALFNTPKSLGRLCPIFSLIIGHICPKLGFVEGAEFIRKVRKLGRMRSVTVAVDTSHGKGSHAMLKQLGLNLDDLN